MANNEVEITQECGQGFDVLVKLVNGRTLFVEKSGEHVVEKYAIDLIALDGTSKSEIILGWKSFAAGIISILLMMMFLKFLPMPDESMLFMGAVWVVGMAISGGCFYMAWNSTFRKQIFYSRNANVPLVELAINNPTKKDFTSFVRKVEGCIGSVQQGLVLSLNNQLAGEMRMLRRLNEEGILSSKVYSEAKVALFEKH